MKKLIIIFTFILLLVPAIKEYAFDNENWLPVLMSRTELEKSITALPAKLIYKPGKIYAFGTTFFVVEAFKGIHVIDNSDPENPEIKNFITVPGCVDLAVKGNIMYVDNAVDLVAVNISSLPEIRVEKRIENVFPELNHPELGYIPYQFTKENRPANTVIVGWEKE